jgi:hypothetical protein
LKDSKWAVNPSRGDVDSLGYFPMTTLTPIQTAAMEAGNQGPRITLRVSD